MKRESVRTKCDLDEKKGTLEGGKVVLKFFVSSKPQREKEVYNDLLKKKRMARKIKRDCGLNLNPGIRTSSKEAGERRTGKGIEGRGGKGSPGQCRQ